MKRIVFMIVTALICGVVFISCTDKATDEYLNFYDAEYRIGVWVSDRTEADTLEFVNSSQLIRKGFFYGYEEYSYKIENDILTIDLPNYGTTYHAILKAEKNMVHLDGIYIGLTIVGADNSGIFTKVK